MKFFQGFTGIFFRIGLIACCLLAACNKFSGVTTLDHQNKHLADLQIAFMPDIHFHDIYGEFDDDSFPGLATATPTTTQYATIRSMRAQLHSTRLFNENYFALIAALDDIAQRGIRYVALPGDFSDDGQPVHLRGLKKILDRYQRDYGITFFAAPGNHDPTRPFSKAGGKMDYLGAGGKEQAIFSPDHRLCHDPVLATQQGIICTADVMEWGYEPVMALFADYGFYPQEKHRYYETPFSQYEYQDYSFATAQQQAEYSRRQYEICHQGSGGIFKQTDYTQCHWITDSSYLVEPIEGLWLLAIDANVYQPIAHTINNAQTADQFTGSGDAGYNKILTHKSHLLPWIKSIVLRAQQQHKTLIAFSHFPMQEFYKGASDNIAHLFGDQAFQLTRRPADKTSQLLADTGLKIHIGGHMHMNNTGIIHNETGNVLVNIQAPSLAAYVPAYKLLTLKESQIEVDTITINHVPRFNELFDYYREEWHHLQQTQAAQNWDKSILTAKNYREFSEWHLRELIRLRFLPGDWPENFQPFLLEFTGKDFLILSQLQEAITLQDIPDSQAWQTAQQKAIQLTREHQINLEDFSHWSGADLLLDFYKLCNAGQLALIDIDKTRLRDYQFLQDQLKNSVITKNDASVSTAYYHRILHDVLEILLQFNHGEPDLHFLLNLDAGTLEDLSNTDG